MTGERYLHLPGDAQHAPSESPDSALLPCRIPAEETRPGSPGTEGTIPGDPSQTHAPSPGPQRCDRRSLGCSVGLCWFQMTQVEEVRD